ncbi:hypothetical protein [Dyadobacter aurulentus]|uniref:hypothetical protein n=1 Tax=Dyadobacter sp. UC 10 TaxID=2605428 RepID=UPI0011F37E7D|nr:hypothetical protein [Dyadobacter sp. UC 10]KAA0991600.1 hypothetical protein FXO21_16205 [Dyadobacter sp. UC 10]
MNIIYTVCNRTNLAHALTLADSVSKFEPDTVFYLCWVDAAPLKELPSHIQAVDISRIEIPRWESWVQEYFDFELLAAARPWVAKWLLNLHPDCELLTFLAPTVLLYQSVTPVLDQGTEFYLTPNILKPLAKSEVLDDKRILNVGMFHSGSWILKNSETTKKTLDWWRSRTLDRAAFDLCNGMNMDQLWMNYIPVWIPKTKIISNPAWHFGLHAILNNRLSENAGKYTVDETSLISADFAGLTYFDAVWSNHQALAGQNPAFQNLLKQYKESLKSYQKYLPNSELPVYGKLAYIRKYRVLRNNVAKKLSAVTEYIDQF